MSTTALILTFNEEKHIERCIQSVRNAVDRVVVVDSGSTDKTRELALAAGCSVFQNRWINYSQQFNWGLDNTQIKTDWVLRLDADEYLTSELQRNLRARLAELPDHVDGVTLNRRIYFMGRWIKHGDIYPRRMLRAFRHTRGRCETRWMDEHIVVNGGVRHLEYDFVDENLNSLTWWTQKHNSYASREVIDIALGDERSERSATKGNQAGTVRALKTQLYERLPKGVRPPAYFVYRYLLKQGYRDGWEGLVFHSLQGLWYRFLVDAKLAELEAHMEKTGTSLEIAARELFGMELDR